MYSIYITEHFFHSVIIYYLFSLPVPEYNIQIRDLIPDLQTQLFEG